MNAGLCFIKNSFDFTTSEAEIYSAMGACSNLVLKMNKGFVDFFKSEEFINDAAKLYFRSHEFNAGAIMAYIYNQVLAGAVLINLPDEEICAIADAGTNYNNSLLSLYCSDSNRSLSTVPERTISSEKELVDFCSLILVRHSRSPQEYAESFKQIYRNILFLDNPSHSDIEKRTFNDIQNIDGGVDIFIEGIVNFLNYVNNYVVIPNSAKANIDQLNNDLKFPVTEEGGGKSHRKHNALKRDFLVDNIEYRDVNCEYHYKLEKIDGARGNAQHYKNRIYFGFIFIEKIKQTKIAISHIGFHL